MIYKTYFWHVVVGLLALLTGLLTMIPQLVPEYRLGAVYGGIHKEINDDETYYLTRAHEIVDGHPTLGNPYLYEEKSEPPLQPWVSDVSLARASMLFFHDLRVGTLAWDFLFPALIVILTYVVFFLVTGREILSVGLTALMSVGINLTTFNRSPSPQFNFVFLLLFFIALIVAIKKRTRTSIAFATTLLGLLFYIYTYYWTFALILLGVTGIYFFLQSRNDRRYLDMGFILLAGSVLGVPYLWNLHIVSKLPYYQESLMRVGLIFTHTPSGITIVIAGAAMLGVFALLLYRRIVSLTPVTVMLVSGVFAAILAVNQHLITGINLEFSSHYYLIAMYVDMFLFAVCIEGLLAYYTSWRSMLERGLIIVIFAYCALSAVVVVQDQSTISPEFVAAQRYAPVLLWLDTKTKTDDVVYADNTFSYLIPAYTRDNVFYRPEAGLYIMPNTDIRRRFIMFHYFDTSLTRESFDSIEIEREAFGNFYIDNAAHLANENTLRRMFHLTPVPIMRYPESAIAMLLADLKAQKKQPFLAGLSGYRIDYIAWDRMSDPEWHLDQLSGLTKVYDANSISIYSVLHTAAH